MQPSEAPRGKPRGIFAEPCEAKDAIPPCGKPQGFLAKKGDDENVFRKVLREQRNFELNYGKDSSL